MITDLHITRTEVLKPVLKPVLTLELIDPPKFFLLGKKKPVKYYLTAQLFYSGVHFHTRVKIVEMAKDYLLENGMSQYKGFEIGHNNKVKITYVSEKNVTPNISMDLGNKASFWEKVFCDLIQPPIWKEKYQRWDNPKGLSMIGNDNVYWINNIEYQYLKGEKGINKIIIEIIKG